MIARMHGQNCVRIGAEFSQSRRIELAELARRHVLPDPDDFLLGRGAQHHGERKSRRRGAVARVRRINLVQGRGRQSAADRFVQKVRAEGQDMRVRRKAARRRLECGQRPFEIGNLADIGPEKIGEGHLSFLFCSYNTSGP